MGGGDEISTFTVKRLCNIVVSIKKKIKNLKKIVSNKT